MNYFNTQGFCISKRTQSADQGSLVLTDSQPRLELDLHQTAGEMAFLGVAAVILNTFLGARGES